MRVARHRAVLLSLLSLSVLAAGCASVPGDAGFSDVRSAVRERTGADLSWERGATSPEVAGRVQSLLASELTADSAVAVALLENRELQATLEELGVAQADLLEAGLLRNPVLGGEVRFPASPARPFEVTVAQPVLEIFLLPLRKRVAAAAFEAAKLRVTDAVLGLETDTRTAFYRLQAAEQAVAASRALAEAAGTAAGLAERQQQAGAITDLDLATERAAAQESELDVVEDEIERTTAREKLQQALGLGSSAAVWKIAAALPELPASDPPLAGLETAAVEKRQDLAALRSDALAAARALPLARGGAIEDAQVGVHRERDTGGETTTGPAASLSVPIFNWGQAARRRAEARERQAAARYAAGVTRVQSEVREAWGRLAATRRQAELYRDALLPSSRRIVDLTQTNYNAMQAGVFQLLQARRDEIRAERGAVAARRDYWVARARLERAVAARLPVAPAAETPPHPPSTTHPSPGGAA